MSSRPATHDQRKGLRDSPEQQAQDIVDIVSDRLRNEYCGYSSYKGVRPTGYRIFKLGQAALLPLGTGDNAIPVRPEYRNVWDSRVYRRCGQVALNVDGRSQVNGAGRGGCGLPVGC